MGNKTVKEYGWEEDRRYLYLNYFNKQFLKNGTITPEEFEKMENAILNEHLKSLRCRRMESSVK